MQGYIIKEDNNSADCEHSGFIETNINLEKIVVYGSKKHNKIL